MAYDDKTIMEDMLSTEKFISGNYRCFRQYCKICIVRVFYSFSLYRSPS